MKDDCKRSYHADDRFVTFNDSIKSSCFPIMCFNVFHHDCIYIDVTINIIFFMLPSINMVCHGFLWYYE